MKSPDRSFFSTDIGLDCLFRLERIQRFLVLAFPVSEKKAKALRDRLTALACSDSDIVERFVGRTGVDLLHRPTGVRVRSSGRGSQSLNRFLARRLLADELEARLAGKTRHIVKAEKIRLQKGKETHRPGLPGHFASFTLRPLVAPDQQPGSRVLERRLGQLRQIKDVEDL
jgi:peptide chain release factor